MKGHGIGSSFLMMILSGLVVGAIGLIEPLVRFWSEFHLIGMPWNRLLALYLGIGLVCGLAAGLPLHVILSLRSMERRSVVIASYHVMGALSLGAVLFAAPFIRHELLGLLFPVSYWVIYPALGILAALATLKLTPHFMRPILSGLMGTPGGRISSFHLIAVLLVVGMTIPLSGIRAHRQRYQGSGRPARAEFRTRPGEQAIQNLLFITVDAVRADHLTCFGYERQTSPNIDSLATNSILFEHCFAQGSQPELALGSLFTSLYPSMHSVRHSNNRASTLPPEIDTMSECLRDAGLLTSGLLNNPYLKREWGLAEGFDRINEFHFGYLDLIPTRYLLRLGLIEEPARVPLVPNPRAQLVVDEALRELETLQDEPFFLYVHLMDAQAPFIPPMPFQTLFHSARASSRSAEKLWNEGWVLFKQLPSDEEVISPARLGQFVDLYDGSIRYMDREIGRLLGALRDLGLDKKTMIVLTSPHGTEFLEHGHVLQRNRRPYDELLHVPLIVHLPDGVRGERIPEMVRQIDLLPTIEELFDLPVSRQAQGRSLVSLMNGAFDGPPQRAYSQSYEFLSVRTGTHKLMYDLAAGEAYCFGLTGDPDESVNCYEHEGATADSLMEGLMDFLRLISVPPEGQAAPRIDLRTREQQSAGS